MAPPPSDRSAIIGVERACADQVSQAPPLTQRDRAAYRAGVLSGSRGAGACCRCSRQRWSVLRLSVRTSRANGRAFCRQANGPTICLAQAAGLGTRTSPQPTKGPTARPFASSRRPNRLQHQRHDEHNRIHNEHRGQRPDRLPSPGCRPGNTDQPPTSKRANGPAICLGPKAQPFATPETRRTQPNTQRTPGPTARSFA